VDGAPLTAEEAEAKENEIINAVKQSRHFRNLTVRRKIRFASIVDYYVSPPSGLTFAPAFGSQLYRKTLGSFENKQSSISATLLRSRRQRTRD
jgi:hypothetical protein